MEDIKDLCDRVILIDQGSILYDGELEALTSKFPEMSLEEVIRSMLLS